jgi:hypothetical protein
MFMGAALNGIGDAVSKWWDAHKDNVILGVGMVLSEGMSLETGEAPLLGRNPRITEGRVNTDLPGGRAVGKSIFRNLTKGEAVTSSEMQNGGIRRTAPDGTQIRMNPDGSTRVDVPRGPKGKETIHIDP